MSVFLGIDIGTSGTKTLAIDEKGKFSPTPPRRIRVTIQNPFGANRIPTTGGERPWPQSGRW